MKEDKIKKLEYYDKGKKRILAGKSLEKFFVYTESLGHKYRYKKQDSAIGIGGGTEQEMEEQIKQNEVIKKSMDMMTQLKTPQQVINQSREEFEKKFKIMKQVDEMEVDGVFALQSDKDKVLDWHDRTFQSFLEAEIARLEKIECPIKRNHPKECHYAIALDDQITHLKGIIN